MKRGTGRSKMLRIAGVVLALSIDLDAAVSRAAETTGQAIYEETCAFCHAYGATGAPRLDDRPAWRQRLSQQREIIEDHVLHGFGAMPPKGGNPKLARHEVIQALDYMLARLTGDRPERADAGAAKSAPTPASLPATPDERFIPDDKYGDDVRFGKQIVTQTYAYARRYTGNGLTCANCHLDAGRRPYAAPFWAAFGAYPAYKADTNRTSTLTERIQHCFRFNLDGFAPAGDAPEVRALLAYMHFLSRGVPVGEELPGRGFQPLDQTARDPSPDRGATLYGVQCAECHGADGQGRKREAGGYLSPPLWGMDSYNRGAGFANDRVLAGFIKGTMPVGREGTLSDQQALDLAAYLNRQLRPWDPRKGMLRGLFE